MHRLNGVEIFRVGMWRGRRYTGQDLDDIAAHFALLAPVWRPVVKLGHGEDQRLPELLGLPSVGQVARVWREGDRLLADLEGIPAPIYRALRVGRYRVSAEIYPRLRTRAPGSGDDEVTLRHVLRAVALVMVPAIKDLRAFTALHFDERPQVVNACGEPRTKGGVLMAQKMRQFLGLLRDLLGLGAAEAYDEGPALEAGGDFAADASHAPDQSALAPEGGGPAEHVDEPRARADETLTALVDTQIDALTRDGYLKPAAASFARVVLREGRAQAVKFGDGDATLTVAEAFETVLRTNGRVVDFSERGRALDVPMGELGLRDAEAYAARVLGTTPTE